MNITKMNIASSILAVLGVIVISIILSWPIQLLWNYSLVGAIDGVNRISFWQAYGLFILANLMFRHKGFTSDK